MTSRLMVLLACLVGWAGAASAEGDPVKGEKIFKKCMACHSTEAGKHRIGPSLAGVIGRQAGTAEGYKYSKAMKAYGDSGVVWTAEVMEPYLIKPREVVKGTKMTFPGLKKEDERADVIAYVMQFSE